MTAAASIGAVNNLSGPITSGNRFLSYSNNIFIFIRRMKSTAKSDREKYIQQIHKSSNAEPQLHTNSNIKELHDQHFEPQ